MSELRDGGPPIGNSPPEDDLRSLIAGFVADDKRTTETPAPNASPKPASAASNDAETPAHDDRGGDEQRAADRPPPSSGAGEQPPPKPGEAPPKPGEPQPKPSEEQPEEPPKPAAAAEAPRHWATADRETFNALPEAARAPFLALYKRMQTGFEPKLERAAVFDRDYAEIDQIFFTPQTREIIAQRGMSVPGVIARWAHTEGALSGLNPNLPKHDMVAGLILQYQVDPGAVAESLHRLRGGAPANGQGAGNGQGYTNGQGNGYGDGQGNGYTNGQAAQTGPVLDDRVAALEQEYQRIKHEREVEGRRTAGQTIMTFANEIDEEGQPKHPFFAEVEAEMTRLAQFERAQGQVPVLQDLYDTAVWRNLSTRERQQALEREAEQKRAAGERRAKAEQARRAGSSVTGAPGPGQTANSAPEMSLRDQIKANMSTGAPTSGGTGRI